LPIWRARGADLERAQVGAHARASGRARADVARPPDAPHERRSRHRRRLQDAEPSEARSAPGRRRQAAAPSERSQHRRDRERYAAAESLVAIRRFERHRSDRRSRRRARAAVSMSPPSSVAGLVLAGGRSIRFGGEKAVAKLEGRTLLEWAAERLRTVCGSVAINVRK